MEITINKASLAALLNDKAANSEITEFLNEIINSEIEKDIPDCDLIDDCINAIEDIEKGSEGNQILRLALTKKQVMDYCRGHVKSNNVAKAVVAAVLVLTIGSAVMFTTSPALADGIKTLFETIVSTLWDSTENPPEEGISSIYAVYSGDTEAVTCKEDIDESKFKVFAVLDNASEVALDLSDCKIIKDVKTTSDGRFVVVTISYGGCACTMAFEMEEKI